MDEEVKNYCARVMYFLNHLGHNDRIIDHKQHLDLPAEQIKMLDY